MTDSSARPLDDSCLGRTCLAWHSDGELIALDRHLVMERLAQVDDQLELEPAPQPC